MRALEKNLKGSQGTRYGKHLCVYAKAIYAVPVGSSALHERSFIYSRLFENKIAAENYLAQMAGAVHDFS